MPEKFIVDIEDTRCALLFNKMKERGINAAPLCSSNTYTDCAVVFSPSKVILLTDVSKIKSGAVIGGKAGVEAKAYMEKAGIRYFNMLDDERFAVLNSIPTALGCIELLIKESKMCINETNALILGYGRIGKTLCKYLRGLDVFTSVYTTDEKELAMAKVFAKEAVNDFETIEKFGLIINTIPAKVMDEDTLKRIDKNAIVCDLASGDFVDIDLLKKRGINAFKAPGLPGKVAPESAAEYFLNYILKIEDSLIRK